MGANRLSRAVAVLGSDGALLAASDELKRLLGPEADRWREKLAPLCALQGSPGRRAEVWLGGRAFGAELERAGDFVLAMLVEAGPWPRDAFARLADGLVHDARGPLNVVALQLEVVSERVRAADAALFESLEKSLAAIRVQVGRLDALMKRFLQFASPRREPGKSVDLADVLRRAVELCEHDARRHGVKIEARLQCVAVDAEASSLAPAILRLVMEGIDASPSGSALHIAVAPQEHDAVVRVSDSAGTGSPAYGAAQELARLLRGTLAQRRFGDTQQIELRVPRL